jgi:hypothetical protein
MHEAKMVANVHHLSTLWKIEWTGICKFCNQPGNNEE